MKKYLPVGCLVCATTENIIELEISNEKLGIAYASIYLCEKHHPEFVNKDVTVDVDVDGDSSFIDRIASIMQKKLT